MAIHSCIANTRLVPHFVYYGEANTLTDYLTQIGVNVFIQPEPMSIELIENHLCESVNIEWLIGSCNRFHLPLMEKYDDYILYTDTDVLFCKDVDYYFSGSPISAANELIQAEDEYIISKDFFNAGVLFINTKIFKSLYSSFRKDCIKIARGEIFEPWYDQGLLNRYFRNYWTPMPQKYNNRLFYSIDSSPTIIHYQYLKPNFIAENGYLKIAESPEKEIFRDRKNIYIQNKKLYNSYLDKKSLAALVSTVPNAVLSY